MITTFTCAGFLARVTWVARVLARMCFNATRIRWWPVRCVVGASMTSRSCGRAQSVHKATSSISVTAIVITIVIPITGIIRYTIIINSIFINIYIYMYLPPLIYIMV